VKILSKASTFAIIALLALIACRLYTTKAAGTPLVALEVRRSDTSNGR
jgi:hypothetical protein